MAIRAWNGGWDKMAYFTPYVDETGYHFPTYNEILEFIVENAREIFGQDIYLGTDSQDYQLFSIFARIAYDSYMAFGFSYDAHSPKTSKGTGLDAVVAINGIRRKEGARSQATLLLIGTAGTYIERGSVADTSGRIWDLPMGTIIGDDGTASVIGTCRDIGQIVAPANTINRIMTPMLGWTSATNPAAAITGSIIETDAQLRARQAISTAQPSASMMEGLIGAIAAIDDVSRYVVYENDTNVVDFRGIPPHSICAVVEGGDSQEIAETIYNRKSTGCSTFGNETVMVMDAYGQSNEIHFDRPLYVDIDVTVTIRPLVGYEEPISDAIKGEIVNYLDKLTIGDDLTISILWWAAQQSMVNTASPSFSVTSITAARHEGEQSIEDIALAYNEVARGNANNIVVNVAGGP